MAAATAAASQHRCVFVGNIPYDATEQQLIQICEEVGPVVSFRLVVDRETGKPKGFGFCEYKDEETALSARRNLQGYEINGRQLRVDFAENDKTADRNREQGLGGPGLVSHTGDTSFHQPIGLPLAADAASAMANALGRAQTASIPHGLQSQSGIGNDPLTHSLSRMSRHQLHEIMTEMKVLATQNKALALQLLQSSPQLSKALFQAEIMLSMVTPQMMQKANRQQLSRSIPQLSSHIGQAFVPTLSRPLGDQVSMVSQSVSVVQHSNLPFQQAPGQLEYQHSQHLHSHVSQGNSGAAYVAHSQPHLQIPSTSTNLVQQAQLPLPNAILQQSISPSLLIPQVPMSNVSLPTVGLDTSPMEVATASIIQNSSQTSRKRSQSLGVELSDQVASQNVGHPSKLRKLEDGSHTFHVVNGSYAINSTLVQKHDIGPVFASEDPVQLPQISSDVQSVLLQQVLSLTPEQLSSLPLEQKEQVLQLQKMLSVNR